MEEFSIENVEGVGSDQPTPAFCWQVISGLGVGLCPILFSPYTTDSPKHNSLQSIYLCCGMSSVEGKCYSLLSDCSVIPYNKDITATLIFFRFSLKEHTYRHFVCLPFLKYFLSLTSIYLLHLFLGVCVTCIVVINKF